MVWSKDPLFFFRYYKFCWFCFVLFYFYTKAAFVKFFLLFYVAAFLALLSCDSDGNWCFPFCSTYTKQSSIWSKVLHKIFLKHYWKVLWWVSPLVRRIRTERDSNYYSCHHFSVVKLLILAFLFKKMLPKDVCYLFSRVVQWECCVFICQYESAYFVCCCWFLFCF